MPNKVADLERVPKSRALYHWTDYIEMLTLQNPEKEISRADIIDRIKERQDLGEAVDLSDELGPCLIEEDDKDAIFVDDCFRMLEYREGAFGDIYPFRLFENQRVLKCEDKAIPAYSMYVFLLLAANLSFIDSQFYNDITSTFEFVSLEALRSYLSSNARIIHFGKNPNNNDTRYNSKLSQKIIHLAEDLHVQVHPGVIEGIDAKNTGDEGLDLVGYFPFVDNSDGILHIFCQCACTEEWVTKQHECSEQNWSNKIKFTAILPHMVFIPFCFRKATGSWYDTIKINRSILVDRIRLMSLIGRDPGALAKFPILPAVNQFLSEEESIF